MARNVLNDAQDDWSPDGWQDVEIRALARGVLGWDWSRIEPSRLEPSIVFSIGFSPCALCKRLVTQLSPEGRILYQACADELSFPLSRTLSSTTYGWRQARDTSKPGVYTTPAAESLRYARMLETAKVEFPVAVSLDVARFFSSITVSAVVGMLRSAGARQESVRLVQSLLERYEEELGHFPGPPQNHLPSSVFANAMLSTALRERDSRLWKGCQLVRWMDDITIFAPSVKLGEQLISQTSELLDQAGMVVNTEKTAILETGEHFAPIPSTIRHECRPAATKHCLAGPEVSQDDRLSLLGEKHLDPFVFDLVLRESLAASIAQKKIRDCLLSRDYSMSAAGVARSAAHGLLSLGVAARDLATWPGLTSTPTLTRRFVESRGARTD